MTITDPFNYSASDLYQYCHERGKRRFASDCKHEAVRNGRCTNCLRKVITTTGNEISRVKSLNQALRGQKNGIGEGGDR